MRAGVRQRVLVRDRMMMIIAVSMRCRKKAENLKHCIHIKHVFKLLFCCFVVLLFCFVVLLFCFVVLLFCCFVVLLFCCFVD